MLLLNKDLFVSLAVSAQKNRSLNMLFKVRHVEKGENYPASYSTNIFEKKDVQSLSSEKNNVRILSSEKKDVRPLSSEIKNDLLLSSEKKDVLITPSEIKNTQIVFSEKKDIQTTFSDDAFMSMDSKEKFDNSLLIAPESPYANRKLFLEKNSKIFNDNTLTQTPSVSSNKDFAIQKIVSTSKIDDRVNNIINNPRLTQIKVELEFAEALLKKIKVVDAHNLKIPVIEETIFRLKKQLEQKTYV